MGERMPLSLQVTKGTASSMNIYIVFLADTHGFHRRIKIPEGDIVIFAGDICSYGDLSELDDFNAFLGQLPHKYKIVVAGNHDVCLERYPEQSKSRLTNAIYLQDQAITLLGIKFYGSPWQPQFMNWAFNLTPGKALREKWDLIPADTDILVTHGPPYGFGDTNAEGEHVGDRELADAIGRVKPKIHVFGHIHEGYGSYKSAGTTLINASICDGMYMPTNPPVVVTLNVSEDGSK
jgi:Icc-related predicted phosphoesterase